MVRFLISRISQSILCLETLSLIDRIIQLGISICYFSSIDEELETLYLLGISRLLLRERRNRKWMIHNESRLNKFLLAELFKEEILDIADTVVFFVSDFLFFCEGSRLFQGLNLVKINARIFLNGIGHGKSSERTFQVNGSSLIADMESPANLLCKITEHGLGELHHPVVIGISLIEFHQGKLRVVTGIDSLVPEYSSDFVNALHTADNQTL